MARLSDSLTINGMALRNRLALPAMTTNYGTAEGEVTDTLLGYYRQRARHVGLVITEATAVRPDGRLTHHSLGLWDDARGKGMATLAKTIKAEAAAAAAQLVFGGARGAPVEGGIQGASPSGLGFRRDVEPTILSEAQIAEIVGAFAAAADRAAAAGFDAVEVHGAHFYLIGQFLSPLTNRREDRYGGDLPGRATFALEVVRALRARLGAGFPILFRLNAIELVEGGQTPEEAIAVARLLKEAGVDAIHASAITQLSWHEQEGRRYARLSSTLPKERPHGANAPYAAAIKRGAGLPVIAVGKMGSAAEAARVVGEGLADVVAIGRQMIADPLAAGKILGDAEGELLRCQECLTCFNSVGKNQPLRCSVNGNPAGEPVYGRDG